MKIFACAITIALVVVIIPSRDVSAADDFVRFACNNGTFGPTPELRAKLAVCYNPELYGTVEGKKHPNCSAFCFTEAIRGLKDGVPDKTAFEKMIDTEFPASVHDAAKKHNDFCFERHSKIDSKDKKCVEIAAFTACGTSLVSTTSC